MKVDLCLRPTLLHPYGFGAMCVCVCVVVSSILGAGFHLWGAPAGDTQENRQHTGVYLFIVCFSFPPSFCDACIFFLIAKRVQHSLSLVDHEVELCVPTTKSLSTVGCWARKKTQIAPRFEPTTQPSEVHEVTNLGVGAKYDLK